MPYPILSKNDMNGYFALLADNLANFIIVASFSKYVLNFPDSIVFGRIFPGLGVALLLGLSYYYYLARKLAKKENRNDVTALPYGISTPILFVYIFAVMLPVYIKTKDPIFTWQVGIGAAFIGGIIEMLGSIIGPFLRRVTPRAGMLGTLAGIAIVWIATVPMAEIFEHPVIGFTCLTLIFMGLLGGFRFPFNIPAGLLAIIVGTILALFMGVSKVSISGVSFNIPIPVIEDVIKGIVHIFHNPEIFAIILPIEIYNFMETMNNVESAEAAGDKYPLRSCQIMDGLGTCVGSLFGSCFPTTVYIGHPGYKKLKAQAGYALLVGITFFLAAILGLISFFHELIPVAAVAPMLVFIGIVITAQAFSATDSKYAMAVAVSLIPHVSNIIYSKMGSLASVVNSTYHLNISLSENSFVETMLGNGIHYMGHSALANGSIITGLIWGAITAYIIDGNYKNCFLFAITASILTFLGIIHSSTMGFYFTPITLAYTVMSGLFLVSYAWQKKSWNKSLKS
ncbi:MAG: xanthine/uracil/vitamin C permease [Pseudomonadota bacterium]